MAEVSVIIVNWNTKQLLKKAVESVLQLPTQLKLEVLVVDNGSSDGSCEMIKKEFKEVKLIQNEVNIGFAKAVNLGLSQSLGRYILLLNSDAQLLPGTLEMLKSALEKNSKAGVAGGELVYEDGRKQNSMDHIPNLATEVLNKSTLKFLFPKWYPSKRGEYKNIIEVPSVIGAGIMLNKEALNSVGNFDEEYFFFMEETDWCYRLKQKGWKCLFVPGAKIIHLQGQTAKQYGYRAKIEYYRSRYLFFKKNYGLFTNFLLLLGLVAKIILNCFLTLLGTLLSLGLWADMRKRFLRYSVLLVWHLAGCPKKMGLSGLK